MSDNDLLKIAKEGGLEPPGSDDGSVAEPRVPPTSHPNSRFILAMLGVLPWVGALISASLSRWGEHEQDKTNAFFGQWLQEHENRLKELEDVARRIVDQATRAGVQAQERLDSEAYLPLVRQGFRVWDRCETAEKRELVRRVLTNAACDSLCDDDFVRRFIEWIDDYNELHFRVMRILYKAPGSTRQAIWDDLHGGSVREDSEKADLFKLLIRDLSTGSVIRQERPTDAQGNFYKKRPRARSPGSSIMKSAFDDAEPYVLTELGKAFVHYALNEVVPKIGGPTRSHAEEQE